MWYECLMMIYNMNITASVVILGVLLVRFLLRKAPKVFSCALWLIVLFRLLCPISVATPFSLFGVLETQNGQTHVLEYLPRDVMTAEGLAVDSEDVPEVERNNMVDKAWVDGIRQMENDVDAVMDIGALKTDGNAEHLIPDDMEQIADIGGTGAGSQQAQVSYLEMLFGLITVIWVSGMVVMAVYSVVSLWELHRKVRCAVRLQGNIFIADYLATPCVSGVIHPRIYLPSSLGEEEQQYILLHEQCHIRHLDYLVKMLAYIALCIYWFNPLVWIAFVFMENDMEMRCDETVLGRVHSDIRADYCQSLLGLAIGRRMIAGIPLAFGDGNLKKRVEHILDYQQFPLWKSMVAGVVCVVVVFVFCTNPVNAKGVLTDSGNGDNRQTISANNISVSEKENNENYPGVSEKENNENYPGMPEDARHDKDKTDTEEMGNGTIGSGTVDNGRADNGKVDSDKADDEVTGNGTMNNGVTDNSGTVKNGLEERRQRADTLTQVSMTEGVVAETYLWFVDNDLYMNGLSDLNYWGFSGRNAVPEDIDVEKWSIGTNRAYYDDTYIYNVDVNQVFLYDRESEALLYTVDLKDYATPMKPVMWAICEQGRLYFSVYANGAGMQGSAYLACMDIENGELLWQTDSMICNSSNFLLWNGILICGYGFTDEEDFLYQIDADTGEVLKQTRVETMPEVMVRKDQQLYVKCYNQAYVFAYK